MKNLKVGFMISLLMVGQGLMAEAIYVSDKKIEFDGEQYRVFITMFSEDPSKTEFFRIYSPEVAYKGAVANEIRPQLCNYYSSKDNDDQDSEYCTVYQHYLVDSILALNKK